MPTGRTGEELMGAAGALRMPLYHQIYLILRQQILDGGLGDGLGGGAMLPGEQDLAARYGVSRITAKRALDELARDGLVVRERGRGTRVLDTERRVHLAVPATGGLDPLITMGDETDATVLEVTEVAAGAELAAALRVSPGAPLQRAVRLRSVDGAAFSYLTTHVPWEIGRRFSRSDLERTPLLALLDRAGATPTAAEQTVSATLADSEVASHLGTEVGAPLLRLRRVVTDRSGRPIEHLVALYRPDRYRLAMTLTRGAAGALGDGWATVAVDGVPAPGSRVAGANTPTERHVDAEAGRTP